jgi:excisionase family DNA binding protein
VHGQDGHGIVIVPGRVAAILERFARLDAFRTQVRGRDSELDAVLIDFHAAAVAWRSTEVGTTEAPKPELPRMWASTSEAATVLRIGDRAIRKAIAEGRLPADSVDGRWRIAREDLAHYRARQKDHHHG